ncbi:UNVERIFIED_CONTAM: hypothetical protein FKN15_005608 [Acipenser sinensis]
MDVTCDRYRLSLLVQPLHQGKLQKPDAWRSPGQVREYSVFKTDISKYNLQNTAVEVSAALP